ncbi:MAG: hypothetical protein SPK23_01570 [Eubacteriales bacterium]|nr:hypothetical protein [Clostridiales bacterium]MDY5835802.1 hypothetical protein [Eubacteriales bacterium]
MHFISIKPIRLILLIALIFSFCLNHLSLLVSAENALSDIPDSSQVADKDASGQVPEQLDAEHLVTGTSEDSADDSQAGEEEKLDPEHQPGDEANSNNSQMVVSEENTFENDISDAMDVDDLADSAQAGVEDSDQASVDDPDQEGEDVESSVEDSASIMEVADSNVDLDLSEPMTTPAVQFYPPDDAFIPTVNKYPATNSPEWYQLSTEERIKASDDFYGMDPKYKQYFEPAGRPYEPPIEVQVWRRSNTTGELIRMRMTWGDYYFVPGERIYIFMKLNSASSTFPDSTMENEFRLGFGFHTRSALVTDPVVGTAQIPRYWTFQEAQNVKLDGQPCHLWDNNAEIYGQTSTNKYPAPKEGIPQQGHKVIDKRFPQAAYHYLSFEYTIPEMLWDGAFTYGSGSTGAPTNQIGARAQHFGAEPVAGIDVRYVLDSDYRTARGIPADEEVTPIQPREKESRFSLIDDLEGKQIADKSPLYSEHYGAFLFPTSDTFRSYDEHGNIITYADDLFKCSASSWLYSESKKPTYQSLIKKIDGYEYVADDFEQNQYDNYGDGRLTKLPQFAVVRDANGQVRFIKHFYVTYKKLPEPPTPTPPPTEPEPTIPTIIVPLPPPEEVTIPIETQVQQAIRSLPATGVASPNQLSSILLFTGVLLLVICSKRFR